MVFVPKALPALDVSRPVRCAPLAAGVMSEQAALHVALRMRALSEPVRVRLLSLVLASGEAGACTCDLAPALGVSEGTASHHLGKLRDAGFVEGTRKGMNVYYRALPLSLAALCRVIDPECC